MKWKTLQKIYNELKASDYSSTDNIIIKYVNKNKQKGNITCKIQHFKEKVWTIYDQDPIIIIIGIESRKNKKILYKYTLFNNPEEKPQYNDNFYIRYFFAMHDKSKEVITKLLTKQISSYLDTSNDIKNPNDQNM